MGRLQSSVGLVTGTNITSTVDQLIAISARPRDRLVARTKELQQQQTAVAELIALVIGVQLAGNRLDAGSQFQARSATSSNEAALTATASANAPPASLRARVTQLAETNSFRSRSLGTDSTTSLGFTGEIQLRAGGAINSSVALEALNQGRGVSSGSIRITDRAGNTEEIDLSKASTIDDVLNAINNVSTVQVRATTSGDSIQLTDISGSVTGSLRVDEVAGGETAADLGLRGINVAGPTAVGTDIYGAITDTQATGLQGIALSRLAGGNGLGTLTSINIALTDGTSAAVDLSSATTTQDIVRLINDSGLKVEAKLNDSASGFRIRDLSGGSSNAFSITSTDTTAAKLGLATTSTSRIIEGTDLQTQTVDLTTKLSALRQGRGIANGILAITDSTGNTATVDLSDADKITVGDLINRINATDVSITASLNSTGDGISIIDNGGGTARFKISDTAGKKTASELGIDVAPVDFNGGDGTVQRINSRQADTITVASTDSLKDIVDRINSTGRFGTASIINEKDGSKSISFRSSRSGDAGRLTVTSTGFNLGLRTTANGKDAVVDIEQGDGSRQQLRSIDGVFTDAGPGVSLTAKTVTDDFVTVTVARDTKTAVSNVKAFVEQFNKLVDKLDSLTFFDSAKNEVGLLFGSSEALRVETSYNRLLSGSVFGAGSIRSISEVGLTFTDAGKLSLSETKLTTKLTENSEAVNDFFTKEDTGLSARLSNVADRIAGVQNSLLINRNTTLGLRIERNNSQTDSLNVRLENERNRLLKQYNNAEVAISKLQSNQNAISQIQFFGNSTRQ